MKPRDRTIACIVGAGVILFAGTTILKYQQATRYQAYVQDLRRGLEDARHTR